jgi:hypothetical protein
VEHLDRPPLHGGYGNPAHPDRLGAITSPKASVGLATTSPLALRRGTWLRQAQAYAALVVVPTDPVEHRATVQALRLTAERGPGCASGGRSAR